MRLPLAIFVLLVLLGGAFGYGSPGLAGLLFGAVVVLVALQVGLWMFR